jgi:hypothetical protein
MAAAVAKGDPSPKLGQKSVEFTPGVSGSAVLLGQPGQSLSYAVAGDLSQRQGTIAFWVKALYPDWLKIHNFLYVPNAMSLWYSHNHLVAFTTSRWEHADYPCPALDKDWHHLVVTWGGGRCARYSDGQLQSQLSGLAEELPPWDVGGARFSLADVSQSADPDNRMALDELMIFGRPLDAVEVRSLYRHGAARLPEVIARLGTMATPPDIDGVFRPEEWRQTAQLADFVDRPFGNLTSVPVRANLGYDGRALYLAVRGPEGEVSSAADNYVEVWIAAEEGQKPWRFRVCCDGRRAAYRGDEAAAESPVWQGAARPAGPISAESCFEVAIPWGSLGLKAVPPDGALRLNLLRRWSKQYGDCVSWVDATPARAYLDPTRYGRVSLAGGRPLLAMNAVGRLSWAQLNLDADVLNPSGAKTAVTAEVSLQPTDLREVLDPALGVRTYTGAQLRLGRELAVAGGQTKLKVARSFSDTDLNGVWLKLTDSSGAVIYQAMRPFVAQPPVVARVSLFPGANRVQVEADTSSYREAPPDELSATVRLLDARGKLLASATLPGFTGTQATTTLPLAPLPLGPITVRTTLMRRSSLISEFETSFEKIAPGPWCGNRLGREEVVVPPFTPVQASRQSVSVWGRTYRWDDSLFPVQITSADGELLAAPMELLAGNPPTGLSNPAQVEVVERTDTRAIVECRGTIGGVPVSARHRIEYDGMCLTELQLKPGSKKALPGLALRLPYRTAQTTLYHYEGGAGAIRRLLGEDGRAELGLRAWLWLGNEDRGVTWFAENNVGWKVAGSPQTPTTDFDRSRASNLGWGLQASGQCLAREADCTSLTLRFADRPFTLTDPWGLTFGFIATPVKKLPDNWRFLRCHRDWGMTWFNPFTASNNDIARVKPGWKELLARQYQRVPVFVPYQRPDWINTRQPEYRYFGQEWQVVPPAASQGSDDGSDNRHGVMCLGSQWQDFEVYYLVKAYDDNGMTGYYFDAGRSRCANAAHGHRGEYPILAYRDFYRRLAVEFSKRGRPYLLFVHSSGDIEMPMLSFTDMIWDGEQFSVSADPRGGYDSLLTLDQFRAEFLGQPFGVPVQWLVEFVSDKVGRDGIDTVLALALVHGVADNTVAGALGKPGNAEYLLSVLNAQDAFGIREKDCTFLPYWRNSRWVRVAPVVDDLVCSAWRRPGKVLLVLANCTQQDQEATLKLDAAELGLTGDLTAADLMGGTQVRVTGDTVALPVPRWKWRLIVVEGAKAH